MIFVGGNWDSHQQLKIVFLLERKPRKEIWVVAKAPLSSRGPSIVQLLNSLTLSTRCLVLLDCFFERGEAGQRPKRGQSPVEHRGTFVCSFICPPVRLSFPDLMPEWVDFSKRDNKRPERAYKRLERSKLKS